MEKAIKFLEYIWNEKGDASTESLAESFQTSKDDANVFIDYLYEKGLIDIQAKMLDGNCIGIRLTANGIDALGEN